MGSTIIVARGRGGEGSRPLVLSGIELFCRSRSARSSPMACPCRHAGSQRGAPLFGGDERRLSTTDMSPRARRFPLSGHLAPREEAGEAGFGRVLACCASRGIITLGALGPVSIWDGPRPTPVHLASPEIRSAPSQTTSPHCDAAESPPLRLCRSRLAPSAGARAALHESYRVGGTTTDRWATAPSTA